MTLFVIGNCRLLLFFEGKYAVNWPRKSKIANVFDKQMNGSLVDDFPIVGILKAHLALQLNLAS